MNHFYEYDPSTGRILQAFSVPITLASGQADPLTQYRVIATGELAARPTLPDLPATLALGDDLSVSGFPADASVQVLIDGAVIGSGLVSAEGVLALSGGEAGAWTVRVGYATATLSECHPAQPRTYAVTVS